MKTVRIDKERFGPWALVTGASSGIGAEFARQLADSGLNLVMVARREEPMVQLGEHLKREYGIDYRVLGLDLSDPAFIDTLTAQVEGLDIGLVVSNAGTGIPGPFLSIPEHHLLKIVNLNSISHLRLIHHFGKRLKERGKGGVILVSAMGALDGIPFMANDAATKAYVTSLGQGLHEEFKAFGVHTTVVMPGPTETEVIGKFGLDQVKLPMKPAPVADCVAEGLMAFKHNKNLIQTGRMMRWILALVPARLTRAMNSRMFAQVLKDGQPRLGHL